MNENKNNTKQVLLSVIGIAILIVAVVGISFAAFSYSRKGQTVNTISTGTITMAYNETTNGINIVDAVPMSVNDGKSITPVTGSANDTVFDFNVTASITGKTSIGYEVVAVKDNNPNTYCSAEQSTVIGYYDVNNVEKLFAETDTSASTYTETKTVPADAQRQITNYTKCNIVPDENIRLYLETTTDNGSTYTQKMAPSAWQTTASHQYGAPAGTMVLTTGTFNNSTATGSMTTFTDYYRLRMWVDDAYVVDGTQRSYKVKVNVYGQGN